MNKLTTRLGAIVLAAGMTTTAQAAPSAVIVLKAERNSIIQVGDETIYCQYHFQPDTNQAMSRHSYSIIVQNDKVPLSMFLYDNDGDKKVDHVSLHDERFKYFKINVSSDYGLFKWITYDKRRLKTPGELDLDLKTMKIGQEGFDEYFSKYFGSHCEIKR